MNKKQWSKIKSKGYKNYLIQAGVMKLGVFGGIPFLTMFYLGKLKYEFSDFDFSYFASEYLIWLPVFIIFGVIIAAASWYDFEGRYGDRNKS
ncbi:hypothetical protein [Kangiella sp. TOML190]|uniref:hypothetical protein n=1 Tax=Kangiella sp. TOML190 TaxID=2931351 RepID=UPI00203FDF58|nr:hypothetical protein [Kangiella sp. TOML190]